jgi:DNA-binding NarL/FixJ family response regulator
MMAKNASLEILEFAGQQCRIWMAPVVSPNAPTSYTLVIDSADDVHRALTQAMIDAGCSEREVEVCMMLARGASNHEVAEKLFIAECTVKDHVTSIFEKLGVTNRSAVVPRLLGI